MKTASKEPKRPILGAEALAYIRRVTDDIVRVAAEGHIEDARDECLALDEFLENARRVASLGAVYDSIPRAQVIDFAEARAQLSRARERRTRRKNLRAFRASPRGTL